MGHFKTGRNLLTEQEGCGTASFHLITFRNIFVANSGSVPKYTKLYELKALYNEP